MDLSGISAYSCNRNQREQNVGKKTKSQKIKKTARRHEYKLISSRWPPGF